MIPEYIGIILPMIETFTNLLRWSSIFPQSQKVRGQDAEAGQQNEHQTRREVSVMLASHYCVLAAKYSLCVYSTPFSIRGS